jgi:hypothetical protein
VRVTVAVSVAPGPIVEGASNFVAGNTTGSATAVEPEDEMLQPDSEAPTSAIANIPDNADFITILQLKCDLDRQQKAHPKDCSEI